jgi:lipoprotein-anchoring transpeptidase ErfK/SrfK
VGLRVWGRLSQATRQLELAAKLGSLAGAVLLLTASGPVVGAPASSHAVAGAGAGTARQPGTVAARQEPARLTISPRNGAAEVRPDLGVTVAVAGGTLRDVVVRTRAGARVPGALSADHASWRTRWALAPGTAYAVRATALGRDGRATAATSSFTTLAAPQTIGISDVTPNPGERVGVGMPIIVSFDQPVRDKAAVERALEVRSAEAVEGAWHWMSDQRVIFRTKSYWRAHQQVRLVAHLTGVQAAPGVYGTQDTAVSFQVGTANVSRVNVVTHRMTVSRDGQKARDVGISAGRGGSWMFTTTSGIHAVMGKFNPTVMTSAWMGVTDPKDPRYYKLTVYDAVQISASGEYVHSAPWSVWAQGHENVSHGCVNASPEFAAWFYGIAQRGDIVVVTGTDRALPWDNGYGFWQASWQQWAQGSALRHAVMTTAVPSYASTPPSGASAHAPTSAPMPRY